MKRSKAVALLQEFLRSRPRADELIEFCEQELSFKPLRYQGSGCMCGHFDSCSCGPGTYHTDWERE